jgi:hypothetical protein
MRLDGLVDDIGAVDPDSMDDAALAEHLLQVTHAREALEAAQLRAMGAFEARKAHKADGAWSAASWLRERSGLSRTESNSLERHARIIRTRPLLSQALDGLGAPKVRTVLRYTTSRTMEAFAEAEATILEEIGQLSVDETATVMRWWARRVDQDGRQPRSWDHNELDLLQTLDGAWSLGGGLDTLTGAELEAALDAEAEAIYRAGGTDGVRLGPAQRRAMALMELIRRSLDPGKADTAVPPTVMVSIDLDDLLKATGQADLIGVDEHLDPETVRRIACDAGITRIINGPRGDILDLGRSVRTAPPRFKKALAVRDRHCVFPGCRMTPNRCRAHHIRWWDRDHGETSLENLCLLCSHHHHLVHEGGWTLTRAPDGTIEVRRPDGTILQI